MRKTIATSMVAGLATLATLAALGLPAAAYASDGPTSTTLEISPGFLSISTPDGADLGTVQIGAAQVQAQLGTVTVSDSLGTYDGGWAASVTSSDFVVSDTNGNAEVTIPASDVSYAPGTVTSTGEGTFTAGDGGAFADSSTPQVACTAADEVGATTASWDPTITVTLPSDVVAGQYQGTITHSVSSS